MIRRKPSRRVPKLKDIDAFRSVPVELSQPTAGGGLVTVVGFLVAVSLMYFEFETMVSVSEHTEVLMDQSGGEFLHVNFDIEFFDLECKYLQIGVRDSFGSDRLEMGQSIKKTSIDHEGRRGLAYTQEEEFVLDKVHVTGDELLAANADWVSSSDAVTHDFKKLVESHDYTVILFYVRATRQTPNVQCIACKTIRPDWDVFEETFNERFSSSSLRVVRLNCADFVRQCTEQGIRTFPVIRMYNRMSIKNYVPFPTNEAPNLNTLTRFVELELEKDTQNEKATQVHQYFPEGCRVEGVVSVARVPGTLHFEAVHTSEQNLNFALTNISHTVHHLSFGEQGEWLAAQKYKDSVPQSMIKYVATLDGQTFATQNFHEAPHHYLKVVSTRYQSISSGIYAVRNQPPPIFSHQYSAQSRIADVSRHVAPSARFFFDIAPVEVRVTQEQGRPWYDFLTSVMAIVGGVVSVGALLNKPLRLLG